MNDLEQGNRTERKPPTCKDSIRCEASNAHDPSSHFPGEYRVPARSQFLDAGYGTRRHGAIDRVLLALAVLGVLALSVMQPVQAQDADSTYRTIWAESNVTVRRLAGQSLFDDDTADCIGSVSNPHYGYASRASCPYAHGSSRFTYDGRTYSVPRYYVSHSGAAVLRIESVDGSDVSRLKQRMGSGADAPSIFQYEASGRTFGLGQQTGLTVSEGDRWIEFSWPTSGLDWDEGDSKSVAIKVLVPSSNVAPNFSRHHVNCFFQENSTVGAEVCGERDFRVIDVNNDEELTFTLGGADADKFAIDSSSGVVSAASGHIFDYEDSAFTCQSGRVTVNACYDLTITVRDSGGLSDSTKVFAWLLDETNEVAPQLSVANAEATEGDDTALDFMVTLTPAVNVAVTVQYATSNRTATAGEDYTATSGTLTFLPNETSKTVSVPIIDDSVEDDGETFTLILSNPTVAVLADSRAIGTIRNSETSSALTASFRDVPTSHDGDAFTFGLEFSEEPASGLSYTTLQGSNGTPSVIAVTNGEVTRAVRKVQGKNRQWTITVEPDSATSEVGIALGATSDCAASGAICTSDGRVLSNRIASTIPIATTDSPALTVSYQKAPPAEHDGSTAFTFRFGFTEDLASGYSYGTMRDHSLSITQGGTKLKPYVKRVTKGSNQRWDVTVTPAGRGDISVRLGPTASCSETGAMCTAGGTVLSNALPATTVQGPPGLSVADTNATEGTDANMVFTVTLSRAASAQVTVDYATSDGTATKGADYTETSGTLTFAVGDTSKTIAVPVLTDTVDDSGETLTLTLSNASGGNAYLADATATGTIDNEGAMPKAWITRFGRTVASQVVDAVGGRLENGGANHVQVGGLALNGAGKPSLENEGQRLGIDELAWNRADATESMTARELLLGSAFSLGAGGKNGTPAFGAWGRFELGSFEAKADGLAMEGDVTTGFLGADVGRDRWLAGLAVSFSNGDGNFESMEGDDAGTVETSLTSVYPYAWMSVSDRVDAWGLVGMGSGELTLRHGPEGAERTEYTTDIAMRMGALGLRGEVLTPTEPGGLAIAVKSDAFWVRTESDEAQSESGGKLGASEGEASRVRLIVEGSRAFDTGNGTLTPSAEFGVRHDGGDAETGTGVEAGAGLRYSGAGVTIEGAVRGLVAHEQSEYEEWGASGAFRIHPGSSGQGLSLSIAPTWGAASSGTRQLWSLGDAGSFRELEFDPQKSLETKLAYGLRLPRTRGLVTPYAALSLVQGEGRKWRTGAHWKLAPEAVLGLEATREDRRREPGAAHAVLLRAEIGW